MNQQIVLGMGAGQCGLDLLWKILSAQPSSRFTLEEPPLLPWERHAGRPGIRERIARWKSISQDKFVGDVAAFYLPYIEEAIECEPGIRIVCLKRSQDEFISAFSHILSQDGQLPINHWVETPSAKWHHDPLWTQTFPQYEIQDRAEAMAKYWREYYQRADTLQHQYPDNVIAIDIDTLTSPDGVRQMLDFAGIDRQQQVLLAGQRPAQLPPLTEKINLPTPRYPDRYDPRKCVILVPFGSFIHQECETALKELERRGYQVRRVPGYAAIDQGRNQIATDALLDNFEETLWIDSDIGFHPDDVEKLRRHDLPIVCGIYAQKSKRAFACEFAAGTQRVTFGTEGGLLEILYAGAGFLLVRRDAYSTIQCKLELPVCNEQLGRPMIPFFEPMIRPIDDGHWYLAEDFSFCERARQGGIKIHADTSIRLWHVGAYRYGWEDAGIEQSRYDSFTLNATEKISD